MTRQQFVSYFFIGLLGFVFYEMCHVFSPFFESIFWAAVFAFGFYPLYLKINTRIGNRPTVAAFLTTLIIFLTIAPLVSLIVIRLAAEALRSYEFFVQFINTGRLNQLIEDVRQWSIVQKIKSHTFIWDFLREHSQVWLLKAGRLLANFAAKQTAIFTKDVLLLALNFILTIFLCFFFLKDGYSFYRFAYEITPLDEKDKKEIFHRIYETFQAVIQGQILTALVQAGLAGLIFTCLGLPLPVLFAGLTFLFSLVPITGAASIWVPFVIYLFIVGHVVKAVILLLLGIFVISLIDNILKPVLIGNRTQLPYLVLFLGILGGLKAFGIMGVFLVPTLLSVFLVLIKIYREKYTD